MSTKSRLFLLTSIDDLISRQAAIEATWFEPSYTDPLNVLTEVRDRLKALPSAQPEQRWIPCSERLPEEKDAGILKKLGTSKRSEYVLATVEVKGERMTVTVCTYDGEWDWNMKYAFPDYKIIAWMPFPEPYREERTEE